MSTYLSPGVYVEEMESGSRPIQGVGTAVAAFVGLAERGPFHTATLVSNWTQFTSVFGGFVESAYLAHAVYGYFMNGGGNCYVVRIGDDGGTSANGSDPARSNQAAPQAIIGGCEVIGEGQFGFELDCGVVQVPSPFLPHELTVMLIKEATVRQECCG